MDQHRLSHGGHQQVDRHGDACADVAVVPCPTLTMSIYPLPSESLQARCRGATGSR